MWNVYAKARILKSQDEMHHCEWELDLLESVRMPITLGLERRVEFGWFAGNYH